MKVEIRCATTRCVNDVAQHGEHYHDVHSVRTPPVFMVDATAMCERCGGHTNGTDWKHVCKSCGKEVQPGELTGLFVPHLCVTCEKRKADEQIARGAVCRGCSKPFARCCC